MKKLFLSFVLLATASLAAVAQKVVKDDQAETRQVSGFHGVQVSTGIHLFLTQGDAEAVAVSASSPEYRSRIITEVKNGVLRIYYENKSDFLKRHSKNMELKAYVSVKSIDELHVNSGALADLDGKLQTPSLRLVANTGAIVKGTVDIAELKVDQNTGSIVTLAGQAGKIEIDGDTGSIFKGAELQSEHCSASASTGAGVYIQVEKELNARANTGGFVRYKGSAGIREVKTSTGGSISRI